MWCCVIVVVVLLWWLCCCGGGEKGSNSFKFSHSQRQNQRAMNFHDHLVLNKQQHNTTTTTTQHNTTPLHPHHDTTATTQHHNIHNTTTTGKYHTPSTGRQNEYQPDIRSFYDLKRKLRGRQRKERKLNNRL